MINKKKKKRAPFTEKKVARERKKYKHHEFRVFKFGRKYYGK